MVHAMPYIRVKHKYQVTIPATIRKKIDLHEGDTLEAIEDNGKIVLVPQDIVNRKQSASRQKPSLLSLLGSNEGSGLYGSAQDIDNTVRDLRDEWT